MKKLAVITPTMFNRPRMLERCKDSVSSMLPKDSEHVVVNIHGAQSFKKDAVERSAELTTFRLSALNYAKYIAFVDDDDYLLNDSLRHCMDALDATGAGIAFTDELLVNDITGKRMYARTGPRSYEHAFSNPASIHHLVMLNTELIPEIVKTKHHLKTDAVQWLMNWATAIAHGAIHVPIEGYAWVQHADNHHRSHLCRDYQAAAKLECVALVTGRVGKIPTYTPVS